MRYSNSALKTQYRFRGFKDGVLSEEANALATSNGEELWHESAMSSC